MIILIIMPTTDNPQELGAERKIDPAFSAPGPGGIPFEVYKDDEIVKIYERHELRELFNVHSPQGLRLEREPSCRDIKLLLRTKLEEYKQEFGFYPREKGWWVNFCRGVNFWPYHPVLRRCPEDPDIPDENLYEYRADSVPGSVLVKNAYGKGYSKYQLRCTNPACPEYKK